MSKPIVGDYVLVCTSMRGVFAGVLDSECGKDEVTLTEARMVVYWGSSVRGLLGLPHAGPQHGSRVTQAAPSVTLYDITMVAKCTEEAAEKFRSAPWE